MLINVKLLKKEVTSKVVTLSRYTKDGKDYFRITIPREFIEVLGWKPHDKILIKIVRGKYLILKKVEGEKHD